MKRNDLSGREIGELTVIGYSHSHIQPSGQKRAMWFVRCSCGVEKVMSTGTLLHGRTVSCGHVGNEKRKTARRLPQGEAAFNYLFLRYIHAAKDRNYEFALSRDEFRLLVKSDCHYCGVEPRQVHRGKSDDGGFVYNGVDRIDNRQGYVAGNVVPCCETCNRMKSSFSVDEFLQHIKKVLDHALKSR